MWRTSSNANTYSYRNSVAQSDPNTEPISVAHSNTYTGRDILYNYRCEFDKSVFFSLQYRFERQRLNSIK